MQNIIQAKDLVKMYSGQNVVDRVSLDVRKGECFGLLGPNGAGKTTTLRMLLGMTQPDGGELQILDLPVPEKSRQVRQYIGVVPQMDNLDPDFSVIENLRTYARYYGLAGSHINQRINELLEFARLGNKSGAKIDALSGGMKRRLTLARSLVNDPRLLILDEPTTGLDPQARQLIWQRLRELKADGKTLILTTHYMEEAQRLCDRLAIMDQGRVITQGTPQELIESHIEPHVIEVYGDGLTDWAATTNCLQAARLEKIGETALIYTHEESNIIDELCLCQGLEFLHRRANLEDVFLKLTGRDLRE
jgi:lipooligosaccharide transport system ATP-binding protein